MGHTELHAVTYNHLVRRLVGGERGLQLAQRRLERLARRAARNVQARLSGPAGLRPHRRRHRAHPARGRADLTFTAGRSLAHAACDPVAGPPPSPEPEAEPNAFIRKLQSMSSAGRSPPEPEEKGPYDSEGRRRKSKYDM